MPLEICKLVRSSRTTICKGDIQTSPSKGYCASQKLHYYGYKLHAVCSAFGVFSDIELTLAYVHDIHYLKNIKTNFSSCVILGDKGYLSAEYHLDLFASNQIQLEVPMRVNQHNFQNNLINRYLNDKEIIKQKYKRLKILCAINAQFIKLT